MGVPLIQKFHVVRYIAGRRLHGIRRYPLVLMLEPLFRCNLSCSGCGKTSHPEEILNRRLTYEECLSAADECGAPIITVAGGEPLIHDEMPRIIAGLVERRRFVYLCTNGLLLKKSLSGYMPSKYLTFSVHVDGRKELHDRLTNRPGAFDSAVEAMLLLRDRGFGFITNCTIYSGANPAEVSDFFDFVLALGARGITLSPAYGYSDRSPANLFLKRHESTQLFREIFETGKKRGWKFNQSGLFLDFLCGNQTYTCTPWGTVTRNVLGWQKPCYLFSEGYAPDFHTLMKDTDWDRYGPGLHPKCAHCMLHSGFEATAVRDAISHPFKALSVYVRGPVTDGPFAPNPAPEQTAIHLETMGEGILPKGPA
ncbi:MAG: adenosyl-hopene transferase HpnH [Syntrophales bacterium]